MEEESAYEWQF